MAKLTCPICGKVTDFLSTNHIRLHGYTVDDFKSTFKLTFLKSDEMRLRQSRFMTRSNPTRGVGHSSMSIVKMKLARTGKGIGVAGKYDRTIEIREKISIGVSRAYLEGRVKSIGHGAIAKSDKLPGGKAWVRSSWELRLVRVLDLHPQVTKVEVEPFQIPYSFEGFTRIYIPDFLVTLVGGVKEVWEVKADYLLWDSKTLAKQKALNDLVSVKGFNSCLVTSWVLYGMEMQVGIHPWVGPGEPWVDLSDPYKTPPVMSTKEITHYEH